MSFAVMLAGCGYFSQFHQDAWSRIKEATVIAIADRDRSKAEAAAARFPEARIFTDAEEMIASAPAQLLDIATPPATHLPLVRAAARARVPVICQKPLAPDWEEAKAVVETAEASEIPLIVHENFRFMPWFWEAKRLAQAGELGALLNITFRLRPGDGQGEDAYLSRQPYFQQMPRFLIHETGVHLIDVFRFIVGEIRGVFARLKRYNPVIKGEDAGLVVFEFESGALGLFDGNRHVDHPADDARMTNGVMFLEGTRAALRLDGFGRLFLKPLGGAEREHQYEWSRRGFGGDCVFQQMQHAVDHLLRGTPLMNSGREYLRTLAIEEAIYRSNEQERFVTV
jgi:D-apiose dehydrogenase